MKLQTLFFSVIFLLASCSSDADIQEESEESEGVLVFFSEFPDRPFENLTFESEMSLVKAQLESLGYHENEAQPFHFNNSEENVEVILQETEELTSLKIFIFGQKKQFYNDLVVLFDEKSTKQSKNSDYLVYEFKTKTHEYSGTLFEMENGMRITFNLKISH